MKLFKKIAGIVALAILLVVALPAGLADPTVYGTGSNGLNPYGGGSNGLNPYGTGSNGLNPYGVGSNGLNPYGTGSNGLNPYGTGSNGLNPYSDPYGPTGNPTGYNPNLPDPYGPGNPDGPTSGPGPINDGPIWATLSNQIIPENSPIGTIVYPGLRNLCFDNNGVNMQVITNSLNFNVGFSGNNLVLNSLVTNFNGQELVGLDCNGAQNSFILTVSPVNDAPTFITSPVTTATRNSLYTYDANAVDAEGDPFTFALITAPSGMTLDINSGVVTWTPTSSQVGTHSVRLRVTDNGGAFSEQPYTITVGIPGTGGGGGGSGGGGSTSNKHSVIIGSSSSKHKSYTCGDTVEFTVEAINSGRFAEDVIINLENDKLGILQTLNRDIKRSISDDFVFRFDIPTTVTNGLYTFVTKLSYGSGVDYDYKTITITCEQEDVPEIIITTEEEPEEEKSIWTLVTLILASLAGVALLVWFVLLLRDEFATTERFI